MCMCAIGIEINWMDWIKQNPQKKMKDRRRLRDDPGTKQGLKPAMENSTKTEEWKELHK